MICATCNLTNNRDQETVNQIFDDMMKQLSGSYQLLFHVDKGHFLSGKFTQSVQAMINAEVITAKRSDFRHDLVTPQRLGHRT